MGNGRVREGRAGRTGQGKRGAACVLGMLVLLIGGAARARPAGAADDPGEAITPPRSDGPAIADRSTARSLERAAAQAAGLDEATWRGLRARVRLAPLLPNLRVTVGRGLSWVASSRTWPGTDAAAGAPDSDQLSYAVTAQWDLSRIVFSREAVQVERDAARVASERTRLALRVARLYARRCQLARGTSRSSGAPAGLAELDAALDILTGGRFSPRDTPGPCPAAPSRDADEPPGRAGRTADPAAQAELASPSPEPEPMGALDAR